MAPQASGQQLPSGASGAAWAATLEPAAIAATRAAAIACLPHVGGGDPKAADGAATAAMRGALAGLPLPARVVTGEGAKDEAPMIAPGERVGPEGAPAVDLAVDPLECTDFCAGGLPGSLATLAAAPAGTLWQPGPCFYLEKLVAGPAARGALALEDAPERTLQRLAEALGKRVAELRLCVLEKPRHAELIARLRAAGARVSTPAQGDVAGALAVLLPGGGADLLIGVGGAPEGIMTACLVRALGGEMLARVAPQGSEETAAVAAAGLDPEHVLDRDELAGSGAIFAATAVTDGPLARAPRRERNWIVTETIVVRDGIVRHVREHAVVDGDNGPDQ